MKIGISLSCAAVMLAVIGCSEAREKKAVATADKVHKNIGGNYDSSNTFTFNANNQNHVTGDVGGRGKNGKIIAGGRNGFALGSLTEGRNRHSGKAQAFNANRDPSSLTLDTLKGASVQGNDALASGQFEKDGTDRKQHWTAQRSESAAQEEFDSVVKNVQRNGNFDEALASKDGARARLNPKSQSRLDGEGQLSFDDSRRREGTYLYTIHQNSRTKNVEAELSQSVGGYNTNVPDNEFQSMLKGRQQWRCEGTASGQGTSECFDTKTGRKVGQVVTTRDQVTVYNAEGLKVSSGKLRKIGPTTYRAVGGDGLVEAKVDKNEWTDCLSEVNGQQIGLKMEKPIKFIYPTKKSGGEETFEFPSCFKMQATFTADKEFDFSRLAIQFDAQVRPIGRLRCVDAASCGKECFYCHYCQNHHKLEAMEPSDSNFCKAEQTTKFVAEVEVCPPPEDFANGICSAFTKDFDYINNKADGVFTIIAYQMPENVAKLQRQFFQETTAPFTGQLAKSALKAEYLIKTGAKTGLRVTDQVLLEYYISKRQIPSKDRAVKNPMTPVVCYRQVVNYSYGGTKVNANYLIDLATTNSDSFFQKRCTKKEISDAEQFKKHKADYDANKTGSGGLLGGLFGGRGR